MFSATHEINGIKYRISINDNGIVEIAQVITVFSPIDIYEESSNNKLRKDLD